MSFLASCGEKASGLPHFSYRQGVDWRSTCGASSSPQAAAGPVPEISSHDELTTFRVKVNVVPVRVVVRDAEGELSTANGTIEIP